MKKRNVGRPRDGDPAETRRKILRAAEESFAAAGFVGATTRQVASRAGVNVATLHYHFGSKERLYRAVLAAAAGEVPEAADAGAGSPAERLTGVVEALWRSGRARPALSRLSLLDRLAGPALPNGGMRERPEDPREELLARTIADVSAKGALSPGDAAHLVLVLLDGALVAARGAPGAGAPVPDASRRAVVAAALQVAGLA